MIDKILNFKNDMSENMYRDIFNEAKETKDARTLFMLAYYVKESNVDEISEEILKTNNLRYISFFMRSIANIDKSLFLDKILDIGSPRDAYYCIFDNRDLEDGQIFKLLDKSKEDKKYYYLSIYHYFITLNRFNDALFNEIKMHIVDMNVDNYKEILEKIRKDNDKIESFDIPTSFTTNRYIGRENYIPDMIVLHSTASWNKGIKNFYDEKMEVSAHFIINTDGEVKQLVSLDDSSWANGTSLSNTSDVYYRFASNEIVKKRDYNANYYTFSIENVSLDGELTDVQYASLKIVIKQIINYIKDRYNYDFIIDKEHIVGHREINPIVRTICPGLKFPMDKLIKELREEI